MKPNLKPVRTLKLHRETLALLTNDQLLTVAGGRRCASSESTGQCSGQLNCIR